ncbi:S46 family peptidase [bacterium AH-315-J04]|nr:S46 family peptidase [bacterium AH-315-J04]
MLCLTIAAPASADEGMWLLNRPPLDLLKQKHNFEPTSAWLEHMQKSTARFGGGSSSSIVSSDGLLMTNHHVGSTQLKKLSTPKRDLLLNGFYAPTLSDELKCEDLEVRILMSIEDMTDRINDAAPQGASAEQIAKAKRVEIAAIEKAAEASSGLDCQVVTLYQGAMYHLYSYKRFTDIRLVWAPEQQAAFFGGDNDNFEYPRFNLDTTFFRLYENNKPYHTDHYLRWSSTGAAEGDLIFVVGHPYSTNRLYTVDHLKFLRDVSYPTILQKLWRREIHLLTFSKRSYAQERIAIDALHGAQNSRKAFVGSLAGLLDPDVFAKKIASEEKLRSAVKNNLKYFADWGDAWNQIAQAQQAHEDIYKRYTALDTRRSVMRSELFNIANQLVQLAEELPKSDDERLDHYHDAQLDSLYLSLYSPSPIHEALEIANIESGLSYLAENFGVDDPLVQKLLDGKSPRARAEFAVNNTRIGDIDIRKRYAAGGQTAIDASTDPMIALALVIDPEVRSLRKQYETKVEAVETQAYAKIAAAQFAIMGEDIAPDATSSLRLSFGTISGYTESGKNVPAFTDMGGIYKRSATRGNKPPFDLPQSWVNHKDQLDQSTPFNFVSNPDIIGGNSGSPMVNRKGEVIGLIFDGNIHSLTWGTVFSGKNARAVGVDARAIIEALRKIYNASDLADEMMQGHRK